MTSVVLNPSFGGYTLYGDPTLATVLAATTAEGTNTGDTAYYAAFYHSAGEYSVYMGYNSFDLSSIPVGSTINSATLEGYAPSGFSTGTFTVQTRLYPGGLGGAVDANSHLTSSEFAAGTLLATLSSAAITFNSYNTYTNVNLVANIVPGGTLDTVMCFDTYAAGSTPPASTGLLYGERSWADPSSPPKLTVNYTEPFKPSQNRLFKATYMRR